MRLSKSNISCGVMELYELSQLFLRERGLAGGKDHTPEELVDYVGRYCPTSIVIFSDNISKSEAGVNLANYIRDCELGSVTMSAEGQSNQEGRIIVWVWVINRKSLDAWKMA